MPQYCEIRIKGHLDPSWAGWFADLMLSHHEGNETLLSGFLPDQAALHGLLELIRDMNLSLISVNCGENTNPQAGNSNSKPNASTASFETDL